MFYEPTAKIGLGSYCSSAGGDDYNSSWYRPYKAQPAPANTQHWTPFRHRKDARSTAMRLWRMGIMSSTHPPYVSVCCPRKHWQKIVRKKKKNGLQKPKQFRAHRIGAQRMQGYPFHQKAKQYCRNPVPTKKREHEKKSTLLINLPQKQQTNKQKNSCIIRTYKKEASEPPEKIIRVYTNLSINQSTNQ